MKRIRESLYVCARGETKEASPGLKNGSPLQFSSSVIPPQLDIPPEQGGSVEEIQAQHKMLPKKIMRM
jgi:hypothetical protein